MDKPVSNIIPAIYKNNFLELTLWAYIQALRNRGISAKQAIIEYREHFKLTEDELTKDGALMIYHRRHKQFCNLIKSEGRTVKNDDAPEKENCNIPNSVFMALINKYFLSGRYTTKEMTVSQKSVLIHFLRDQKTSAETISKKHLYNNRLCEKQQKLFDGIVSEIENSNTI